MTYKARSRSGLLVFSSVVAVFALHVGGCAHFHHANARQNASVVDFLFPQGAVEVAQASVPTLNLPVDVGVAFVPATSSDRHRGQELSEERKVRLLKDVAREFEGYKFVRRIEVIPTSYLRPGGSFAKLEQVARMFGVQVIALVSYDQMQFTDVDVVSLAYWTVVGSVRGGGREERHADAAGYGGV